MARVTVEDCIDKIHNRYDLVMIAAQRAKDISKGAEIAVERDDDKDPVVALREISEDKVDIGELQKTLVIDLQQNVKVQEPEEEEREIMSAEKELAELDGTFSGLLLNNEITDNMQIHGSDDDIDFDSDLDSTNGDDESFDDEDDIGFDDGAELDGDDVSDFDEE